MALDLSGNPLLEAAQDSQSRHPIIEIISRNPVDDIPFDGQFLTSETINEQRPNVITHSSGRLCGIYLYEHTTPTPYPDFKYFYTDEERTIFNYVTLDSPIGIDFIEASICELVNGNIGIIYYAKSGTNHRLYFKIITVTGSQVVADTQIATYTSAYVLGTPFVIKLANDSYLLVYTKVDGASYRIMKRTSPIEPDPDLDFRNWSAESILSIGGLSASVRKYDTSLRQISTGEIFLWFTYVDSTGPNGEKLTNVYYSISSDNGGTWENAVRVTNYNTYRIVAEHPVSIQKVAGQQHLIFNEKSGAIYIQASTPGFCAEYASIIDLSFDPVQRKLYALSVRTLMGTKSLYCVVKIDVDSWTIDKCWNDISVPAFNTAFFNVHVWTARHHGERNLFPVSTASDDIPEISILDGEADTITTYIFKDYAPYGKVKNVDISMAGGAIFYTWVDFDSKRLYCVLSAPGYTARLGYLDLLEVIGESGLYTWNQIRSFSVETYYEWYALVSGDFVVVPSNDYLIVSFGHTSSDNALFGSLKIFLISDGGEYKDYRYSTNPAFPYHGLTDVLFLNNKIYGNFTYEVDFGQADYRGLCEINLLNDAIIYHRPTYETLDDYGLGKMVLTSDGKIIMTCPDGVAIFNTMDNTWERITSSTLPGLFPPNVGTFYTLAYDEEMGLIYGGAPMSMALWDGAVVAFSVSGYLRQARYSIGSFGVGVWSWGTIADLVLGIVDYDLVPTLDPDDNLLYVFWTNKTAIELSIKWDKESTEFDVSPYLLRGQEMSIRRSIDGSPNNLSFSASHGHLFDPHNLNSLWSIYLAKFRRLDIRLGEKIGGANYWQEMGTFFVRDLGLSYERPQYPVISVAAEDIRGQWDFMNILATEFYETSPKVILGDVITTWTSLLIGETDFPIFNNSTTLFHQWVDTSIKEILDQVCYRFGYYPRMTVEGKISARKISGSNLIDHIYSDLTKIMNFTPDDSFSDYTNQVLVIGESRNWLEVLYAEEPFGGKSGAAGWWHKRKRFSIWYSDDHSRRCRYPRLEIIESVRDGPYFMKDGREYITSIRSDELGFVLVVEGPDLVRVFINAVVIWVVLKIVCYILNSIYMVGGMIALVCFISSVFAMYNIMAIMGTQGLYQYNFHACPIGKVRQSIQAIANDYELQTLIGAVVQKKIDDDLCYTQSDCQLVADFELFIAMAQRKRVRLSKMAHLQDEEGDTIQIVHPFSGQILKLFITDLERKMMIPSSPQGEGYFVDDIEGWVI